MSWRDTSTFRLFWSYFGKNPSFHSKNIELENPSLIHYFWGCLSKKKLILSVQFVYTYKYLCISIRVFQFFLYNALIIAHYCSVLTDSTKWYIIEIYSLFTQRKPKMFWVLVTLEQKQMYLTHINWIMNFWLNYICFYTDY